MSKAEHLKIYHKYVRSWVYLLHEDNTHAARCRELLLSVDAEPYKPLDNRILVTTDQKDYIHPEKCLMVVFVDGLPVAAELRPRHPMPKRG